MNNSENYILPGGFEPARLFPAVEDASTLLVLCRPEGYSASEIARAVEDCDAHVINLNVTADRTPDSRIAIHLRVNRRSADAVTRSIERFGYEVIPIDTLHETSADYERAKDRAAEILRYLEM